MATHMHGSEVGMPERWRKRLSDSGVLDRLLSYYNGKIELSNGQVMLGIKFMDKLLPTLKQVEINATVEHKQLTKLELEQRLLMLGRDPKEIWNQLNPNIIESVAVPVRESEETEPGE